MTNPRKTDERRKNAPEEMVNQLADSVLELSDDEILAEERTSGDDPVEEADYVRSVLRDSKRYDTTNVNRIPHSRGAVESAPAANKPVAKGLHNGAVQSLIRAEMQIDMLRRQAEAQSSSSADELARVQGILREEVLRLRELMQQMRSMEISVPQGREVVMDTHKLPIRIVIADSHPIFRDGLRRLLEARAGMKVVGEACDGAEAVKLACQLKPDILLLDLAMPRYPGLEALRELSTGQQSNPVRVILLTAAAEKSQIVEALQLGARGVVLKDSATQLLLKSIDTVMTGEDWVGQERVSNLVQYLRMQMQESQEYVRRRKYGLTPREMEIVSAVVAGYSNREISQRFQIAEDTVKHRMSNIFDKLGVSTRLELALFAVNQSLPIEALA